MSWCNSGENVSRLLRQEQALRTQPPVGERGRAPNSTVPNASDAVSPMVVLSPWLLVMEMRSLASPKHISHRCHAPRYFICTVPWKPLDVLSRQSFKKDEMWKTFSLWLCNSLLTWVLGQICWRRWPEDAGEAIRSKTEACLHSPPPWLPGDAPWKQMLKERKGKR